MMEKMNKLIGLKKSDRTKKLWNLALHRTSIRVRVQSNPTSISEHIRKDPQLIRYMNFWNGIKNAVDNTDNESFRPKMNKLKEQENKDKIVLEKLKKHYILHPEKDWKLAWDLLIVIFTTINCLYVPFALAYRADILPLFDTIYESITVTLYFLDMGLTFNTAIIESSTGKLVLQRKKIALRYIHFWFWVDLFSTFPFDLIYGSVYPDDFYTLSYLELFRVIRFLRLFRMGKLRNFIPVNRLFSFLFLLTILLVVTHIVGCIWYYMAIYNPDINPYGYPSTWIDAFVRDSFTTSDRYIISSYFAIYTMVTVGYGDVHPVNTKERVFTIAIGSLGGIILGVILDQVTRLVESSNPQERAIEEKMAEFRAYLRGGNDKVLSAKAVKAYNYYLQRKSDIGTSQVFEGLPPSLLNKLITSIYGSTIKRVVIFRHIAALTGNDFIVNLIMNAKPHQVAPLEIIAEFGDMADEMTFILRGTVQISTIQNVECPSGEGKEDRAFIQSRPVVEGYATAGYFFGDFEYHLKSTRIASYSAYNDCNFISIDYAHIDQLSMKYEDAGLIFGEEIKSRLNFFNISSKSSIMEYNHTSYTRTQLWKDGEVLNLKDMTTFLDRGTTIPTLHYTCVIVRNQDMSDAIYMSLTEEEMLFQRYLIRPEMTAKTAWDAIIMLLTVSSIFVSTTQFAFDRDSVGGWYVFDWVIVIFFLLDIIAMFATPYYHKDVHAFICNHELIAKNYLSTWLLIDLASSLPYDDMLSSTDGGGSIVAGRIVRVIRLLRLFRAVKLYQYYKLWKAKLALDPTTTKICVLLLQVFCVNHAVACVFWYLCKNMTDASWIDNPYMVYSDNLRYGDLLEQYVVSMYFSFVTLLGIGFGDIVPTNTAERFVTIMIIVVGSTVFSYVMARVAEMLQKSNSPQARLSHRLDTARGYLLEKDVPTAVTQSILRFVEVKGLQSSLFQEAHFLKCLPARMSTELYLLHRANIIHWIPIFDHIPNRSIAAHIYNLLTVSYFDTNEYIFTEGETVNEVRFIVTGNAALYRRRKREEDTKEGLKSKRDTLVRDFKSVVTASRSTSSYASSGKSGLPITEEKVKSPDADEFFIADVGPGDFFGARSIMKSSRHKTSLYSTSPCSVYVLQKSKIIQLLQDHPSAAFSLQTAFIEAIRHQRHELKHRTEVTERTALLKSIDASLEAMSLVDETDTNLRQQTDQTTTTAAGVQPVRFLQRRRSFGNGNGKGLGTMEEPAKFFPQRRRSSMSDGGGDAEPRIGARKLSSRAQKHSIFNCFRVTRPRFRHRRSSRSVSDDGSKKCFSRLPNIFRTNTYRGSPQTVSFRGGRRLDSLAPTYFVSTHNQEDIHEKILDMEMYFQEQDIAAQEKLLESIPEVPVRVRSRSCATISAETSLTASSADTIRRISSFPRLTDKKYLNWED